MYKKVKTDYEFLSVLYDDIVYSEDQLDENSTDYDRRDVRYMTSLLEQHINRSDFRKARRYVNALVDLKNETPRP